MLADPPHVLLVEDDPIAREVVQAHLSALGCRVDAVSRVSQALEAAHSHRFDVLVLDCQLGDGNAQSLLRSVREHPSGASQRSPAIAMSADLNDARFDALVASGFTDAMEKPIHRARLRHALSLCSISTLIETQDSATQPAIEVDVLDDAAGLQACGSQEVLSGLRLLLAQELPVYRAQLDLARAGRDESMLRACVHRMRSALGFCGARELLVLLDRSEEQAMQADVVESWHQAMDRLMLRLRPD